MIYIRYGNPIQQVNSKYSAYITFNYNPAYVDAVKSLPVRYWDPNTKSWEIPTDMVPKLVAKVGDFKELNECPIINIEQIEPTFKTEPLKHQLEGVLYGIEHNSFILGDEQGLGKTKQMIDLAIYKKEHEGLKHCLIIPCIANLKSNWIDEIRKHSNEKGVILGKIGKKGQVRKSDPTNEEKLEALLSKPEEFFWITNIETLRTKNVGTKEKPRYKSEFVEALNELIKQGEVGMIVVDEIHEANNPTSAQGRGLDKIRGCSNRIPMSGTIHVNNALDLYMPLRFAGKLNQDYYNFQIEYCVKDFFGSVIGFKNMDKLQALLDSSMLRRKKDLLDLPPKIHKEEYIELSAQEMSLYKEILTATKMECDKIKNPVDILPKLTRLRQVCCHTGLVSSKVVKSSKFERLRQILNEAKMNNQKVIVFSMFRELVEIAVQEFKDDEPLHIWGQMSDEELDEQKSIFQNSEGYKVLFGQIKAAGTGHTLSEAEIVVFLDLPWNYARMEQAEDRAHRIGTKKSVLIISLLAKGLYDEVLFRNVISKGSMGEFLVDGKNMDEVKKFINMVFEGGDFEYEETYERQTNS